MAKFLANRNVIYVESVIIEADTLEEAQKKLDEEGPILNWDNSQFLATDYYEIVEEVTEEEN